MSNKQRYIFKGNVYYQNRLLKRDVTEKTEAVSKSKAINNIKYKLSNKLTTDLRNHLNPGYIDIDPNEVKSVGVVFKKEEPKKEENNLLLEPKKEEVVYDDNDIISSYYGVPIYYVDDSYRVGNIEFATEEEAREYIGG